VRSRIRRWLLNQGFDWSWFPRNALCRLGRHCRPQNQVRKFDGGRCPLLCRHCRKIVGNW